jgi:hypothetical protein
MNYNLNKLLEQKEEAGCATLIVAVIFVIALAFGISCLYAWIGMLLWNWIVPMLWAGAPVMTFWPMWGLCELCSILFKARVNIDTNK